MKHFANTYEAAKFYRSLGWSVVPVARGEKFPALASWKELQSRLPTDEELELCRKPNIGVGLITGKLSNLAVVDLDGPEGLKTAGELGLSSPLTALSGGAGRHLFYRMPNGLKNSVKCMPGLDIRAEGGFIVLAPSVHSSGRPYRWLSFMPQALGAFPEKLLNRDGDNCIDKPINAPGWISEALASLANGNRNNTFAKVVGKLHRDGWTEADIRGLLTPHAVRVEFDESELDTILGSITSKPRATAVMERTAGAMSLNTLLHQPEVKDWIIKDVIPANSLTILGGLPGVGKTWLALDLALELATAAPQWLGHFACTSRRALYIDEESSAPLLAERVKLLMGGKQTVSQDKITFLVGQGISFTTPQGLASLKAQLAEHRPEIVFVDSLIRVHGKDENSSTAMAEFFGAVRNLIREFGCSFLFVDHEGKGVYQREELKQLPTAGDLRGSNEKAAAIDVGFSLRKRGDSLVLFHTKVRWTKELPPQIITLSSTESQVQLRSIEHGD